MNHLDLYFLPDSESVDLPLDKLEPSRRRPTGVLHAAERMEAAAKGEYSRRAPISVTPIGDGRFRIVDGNSTYAVAMEWGWSTIRCRIVVEGSSGSER